jgi:Icc-related predicted phosphoesterase
LAGCKDLLETIETIKPSIHICGHIHEARGFNFKDGIVYMNACSVNLQYNPVFKAYVFDMGMKSENQNCHIS